MCNCDDVNLVAHHALNFMPSCSLAYDFIEIRALADDVDATHALLARLHRQQAA